MLYHNEPNNPNVINDTLIKNKKMEIIYYHNQSVIFLLKVQL